MLRSRLKRRVKELEEEVKALRKLTKTQQENMDKSIEILEIQSQRLDVLESK